MSRRIPIRLLGEGIPVVPADVCWLSTGRTVRLNFLVDTGAFDISLSEYSAKSVGALLRDFKPAPRAASGIGGNVRMYDIGPTALSLPCQDGSSWTVMEDHMLVVENPRSKRARRGIEFLPCFIGRRFMQARGLILHWDFGRNEAYLETPDHAAR